MEENNFSTFIKELRMEKGLSQEELAKALFVHRTTVNKWENGNVIPLNDKLLLIANYFDISVDELLNGKRNEIGNVSLTRNNNIIELIKSKTRSEKLFIFSIISGLIILMCFLAYYFISNYNSVKVFILYGENEKIRTRDGLLFFSKDKVYFRPGNFYDHNDDLINVDLIRLYYFDENNEEVIVLTGSDKELYIEIEKSRESFIDRIYKKEKFYMDACYNSSCQKMELSYFNDFKNDDLISKDFKSGSLTNTINESENNSELISFLSQNGFVFNEEDISYYKVDGQITYNYFKEFDLIKVNHKTSSDDCVIKIYLNSKKCFITDNISNINIYISDYTNKKDKNYKVFKNYYDKFLSKYFRDFLVV